MEAPHLKQNIHTSLGFRPFFFSCWGSAAEKYFIHIKKAISFAMREPPSSACPLLVGF
jgi:hypothetical protein